MWAAEGLVTRSSCTDRTSSSRKSLEEVANDYMNELALVGLVEIVQKTSEGWIKSIRMHDLVRDVCLEKATTEDFLKIMDVRPGHDKQQLTTSDYYSSNRLIQLSIYLSERVDKSILIDSLFSKAHKYIRSLLFTMPWLRDDGEDHVVERLMESICNELRMLRVLVLKNMGLKGRLTTHVGNLLHLRYLSLESTHVCELPSSIGKLRFLEILNLDVEGWLIIPNTLWKLFRLRHLLLPSTGYEIKKASKLRGLNSTLSVNVSEEEPEKLRADTLIWLETIENMHVEKHRTKDLLKIKNLRKLSLVRLVLDEKEMQNIIAALKSSVGSCSVIRVEGNVISKKDPTILSGFVCNHELQIYGRISVPLKENVDYFSQLLVRLELEECELEDDPMRILGSLCRLRDLQLKHNSYVGAKLSCHSNSFPVLTELRFWDVQKLEVWELENGSMPKLESIYIRNCENFNGIPDVLPSSLKTFFIERWRSVKLEGEGQIEIVDTNDIEETLNDAVLKYWEYNKFVLLSGGMETTAMSLYQNKNVNRRFDAVARICVPKGRRSDAVIPRHILQQLLRDLTPQVEINDATSLSRMNCESLMMELQQVMQQSNCLVVLEEFDLHRLKDLDTMFGLTGRQEGFQSKLVITNTTSDINDQVLAATAQCHRLKVFKVRPPTPIEIMYMLKNHRSGYWDTNAGIKWNMLRHCSNHPFSILLLAGLLKMKENLPEWTAKHSLEEQQVTGSNPQKIFAMCYNDLPLHLKSCLIFLASFSENVEVPTKRLFQMWIAAGFVRSKHDEVVQTEEHLEKIASTYLTELVQRGMVTILNERAKTCQLRLALRDMCLEKAKEEHILTIVDLFDHRTIPTTNAKSKTQQLALHLDQNFSSTSTTLHEQLISSLGFTNSPTSLLIFPYVSDPLYNEEKWEWLLYICKHFQLLRVLDLGGIWMTKGSLPKDVGDLRQLRYLSLKGTWVSELPSSIENLRNLQTLDLRVLESIILPDVLWKLSSLMHLYLPEKFTTQETVSKLQIRGLNCLQILVNFHTDKVCLNDLFELKLLRKISIKKFDAMDELDNILKQLSKSLEVSINSEIINANSIILSSFQSLHKLEIKGMISVELCPEMFPENLEELTLKHTILERDPLPVLEKLPKLRRLFLGHESFLGGTMIFSGDFHDRTNLTLCSLKYLHRLCVSKGYWERDKIIEIIDCRRVSRYMLSHSNTSVEEEEQVTQPSPKCCFDSSPFKKGFACW